MAGFAPSSIERRVFIVGCPRSKTTAVQTSIAGSQDCATFPETRFFFRLRCLRYGLGRLGVVRRDIRSHLHWIKQHVDHSARVSLRMPRLLWGRRQWTTAMLRLMDEAALQRGARYWIEKSPRHFYFIADIQQKYVPNYRVLHTVRDPLATVASLYDVTRRNPGEWGGNAWPLEVCCQVCRDALQSARCGLDDPNQSVVIYEDFCANPRATLNQPDVALFGKRLTRNAASQCVAIQDAVLESEVWKRSVNGMVRAGTNRFSEVFDAQQQDTARQLLGDAPEHYETLKMCSKLFPSTS